MQFRTTNILLFLFLFSRLIFAGNRVEGRENDFCVSLGLTEYQIKEFVLNKVKHHGIFPSFGLSYEIPKESVLHDIEIYFIFTSLKSCYEKENASFASNVEFNYKYAYKIKNIDQHLKLFFGSMTGMKINIAYYENWDESHYYWLTSYYLGIHSKLEYQEANGNFFSLGVQIPLFALISRPPDRFINSEVNASFSAILGSIHDNLELTSIHKHFDLGLNLSYTFRYTGKFKQMLSWRFRYVDNHMAYSKRINILTHTFNVTFLF